MKQSLVLTAALGLVVGALVTIVRSQQDQDQDVEKLMRMKLEHSQKVLEGVVTEDFELVADNARSLKALSEAAEWRVFQTPEYRQYSAEFRRTADILAQMAEAKNLDGAALNYVQLTMNCVHCHKYVRNIRLAHAD